MNPLKSRLAVAAVFLLAALLCLLITAINVKAPPLPSDAVLPDLPDAPPAAPADSGAPSADADTPPDTAASDAVLPQAQTPTMKTGKKKNNNVYLQSLDIAVEVTGNIASTRYTMVFKNRTDRILEGELTFPLPDGRGVTHYALDIDGKMREAVPVDKAKATRVFEEIERRRVDPGLLERVEGNNFRTRVYPIPANGTRTVSVGYEEELTLEKGLRYYRLPMAYANPFEKFAVTATVLNCGRKPLVPKSDGGLRFGKAGENYAASFARENYRPARPLIFALPIPAGAPQVIMRNVSGSNYFLASAAPKIEPRKKQWAGDLAVIWDVSLSGSRRDLKREKEMLDIIFAEKKNANVHLYFLNNRFIKKGEYKVADGNWDALKNVLDTAVFDGGTDFSQIKLNDIAGNEILFFSDGISTLSGADFLKDAKAARPIHCVVSSAAADYSAMKLIAGKANGKFINVSALSADRLKEELLNETPLFLGAEHGKAVREVYPSIATPVHGEISIAGISDTNNAELTLLFGFGAQVEKRVKVILNAKDTMSEGNIHKIWAQKKIAELDLEYEKNRAELAELGQKFGIVTRNTSLLVLETIDDYFRYDIEPPASEPELLTKYRNRQLMSNSRREQKYAMLAGLKNEWQSRREEWRRYVFQWFLCKLVGMEFSITTVATDFFEKLPDERTPKPFNEDELEPSITVKPIKQDNDYMNGLTGKIAEDYQTYLKLMDDYGNSPAFYFDMSRWFYNLGDREAALRALTSIAELGFENAPLYRMLGYRFKEYGEYGLQKFVCRKVMEWRPMEPQSYRDYALALADNGEAQAALDSLCSLLARPFPSNIIGRSSGMEEIIIMEINNLTAKNPRLKILNIDKRLLYRPVKLPVDIRVVINWNMDNTGLDLYVADPRGEECYYRNRYTRIGGYIIGNSNAGYGPVQFILNNAVKGKYQVYVRYYGDNQFTEDGTPTVMAEVYTKYGGQKEQRKAVTLLLPEPKEEPDGKDKYKVVLAEFEI